MEFDWVVFALYVIIAAVVLITGYTTGEKDGYRKGYIDGTRAARGFPVGYTPNGAQRRSSGGMAHPDGQAHRINVREETDNATAE